MRESSGRERPSEVDWLLQAQIKVSRPKQSTEDDVVPHRILDYFGVVP
jgi:hypothetical protein